MAKKSRKRAIPPHGKVALASLMAVAVTVIAGLSGTSLPGQTSRTHPTQDIALEHTAPVTLSLVISEGRNPGIVDLWHDGDTTHHLTVPATWKLREVRGTTLDEVAKSGTGDFTRLAFPAGSRLSFIAPNPEEIVLHNSSRGMMQVKWKMVDIHERTVREETMLVKNKPLLLR